MSQSQNEREHRASEANTRAALTLVDDWTSFKTRLGATRFLAENPLFPDAGISRVWQQIYQEQSVPIVVAFVNVIASLNERAKESAPLLVHHLYDQRPLVAEAAARALCTLAPVLGHAIIPLLTAPLENESRDIRDAFIATRMQANDPLMRLYRDAILWVEGTPRQVRRDWLEALPRDRLFCLDEKDWIQFLVLFSDPRCEHVWGGIKALWQATDRPSPNSSRELAACEAGFFRLVLEHGDPIRSRILGKVLLDLRPYTASLAEPLARIALEEFPEVEMQLGVVALKMQPETPPARSLAKIVDGLWHQNERGLQEQAATGLCSIIPELGFSSAHYVIDSIFEFLTNPGENSRHTVRDTAEIMTDAQLRDFPYICAKARELLRGDAPIISKAAILKTIPLLKFDSFNEGAFLEVKSILTLHAQSADRRIAGASRGAITMLNARKLHQRRSENQSNSEF